MQNNTTPTNQSILITGASGFIGSFIVEKALAMGFEVWAAMRKNSRKTYLQDTRIHFIELNLNNADELKQQLSAFAAEHGSWHYIIHAAGATKARKEEDFLKTNYYGTINLVESLRACGMLPKRIVYLSSLSVLGAIKEDETQGQYPPILASDKPCPNTAYGRSKLLTENYLAEQNDLDYVVVRPTGVYGPREKDYFLMMKTVKSHINFSAGFKRQEITFVYVKDLVNAIFLAMQKGQNRQSYLVSDGESYSSSDFCKLIQKELKIKYVLQVTAPLCVLKVICGLCNFLSNITGSMIALNNDKYNILRQRNWRCDISDIQALGYVPEYNLERGVRESVIWYKNEHWL